MEEFVFITCTKVLYTDNMTFLESQKSKLLKNNSYVDDLSMCVWVGVGVSECRYEYKYESPRWLIKSEKESVKRKGILKCRTTTTNTETKTV